jgi:hypothetical protein
LESRVREVRAALSSERPDLDRHGWDRAVLEQLLFELDVYDLVRFLRPAIGELPVDHRLDERRVMQALAVMPMSIEAQDAAAFLVAILNGERAAIEAGAEVFGLTPPARQLFEGPFPFSAKS